MFDQMIYIVAPIRRSFLDLVNLFGWFGPFLSFVRFELIKKKQPEKPGFVGLFFVVVNYTYGPIDVPICEGDELALE